MWPYGRQSVSTHRARLVNPHSIAEPTPSSPAIHAVSLERSVSRDPRPTSLKDLLVVGQHPALGLQVVYVGVAGHRHSGASIGLPITFHWPPVLAWRRDPTSGAILAMLESVPFRQGLPPSRHGPVNTVAMANPDGRGYERFLGIINSRFPAVLPPSRSRNT